MKILAIEFSPPQRSVAFVNGSAVFEAIETAARDADALGMIENILRAGQVEREQIECVAVGLGPGSYHGIRAAISLAQGWQLAKDVKLLGISSAEGVAEQARADGFSGNARVVIDAQRNEFYSALYQISADACREISSLRITTMTETRGFETAGEMIIGPEVTRWFPSGKIIFPTAATIGKLAARRTDFISGEKLEPIYLRDTTFVKAPPLRVIT